MSSDQGDEGGPDANTGPKNSRPHRQILKKDATFIEVSVGAWNLFLYGLSALLLDHYQYSSALVFLAGAVASLFVVLTHFRHVRGTKRLVSWRQVNICAVLHVALLGAAAAVFFLVPRDPPFRLKIGGTMITRRFDLPPFDRKAAAFALEKADLWAVAPSPNGNIAVTFDMLTYVTLTNASQTQETVTDIELEVADDESGPWDKMCPVDLRTRAIFFAHDPTKATQIKTDNALDSELEERPITSGGIVGGWTAWGCPEDSKTQCRPSFLRYTIYTSDGRKSRYVVSNLLSADGHAPLLKSAWHIGSNPTDISAIPLHRGECRYRDGG